MKRLELENLIESIVKTQLNEVDNSIDVEMAILSHLSDIQTSVSQPNRKLINLIKALVMDLADGKKEMPKKDIDNLWNKWVK